MCSNSIGKRNKYYNLNYSIVCGRAYSGNEVGQASSCAAKSEWKTALSPPSATLQCQPDPSSPDCNNHSNAAGSWSLERGIRVAHSSCTTSPATHCSGKVSNTPARTTCHSGHTAAEVGIKHRANENRHTYCQFYLPICSTICIRPPCFRPSMLSV